MKSLMRYVVIGTAGLLSTIFPAVLPQAQAQKLYSACWLVEPNNDRVACDLRFSEPQYGPRAKSVSVTWPPSTSSDALELKERNLANDRTAWMFVVTATDKMRWRGEPVFLEVLKDDLDRLTKSANPTDVFGLYTIADDNVELAELGSSRSTVSSAVAKIKLKDTKIQLYRRLLAALERLNDFPPSVATRKALVLFSNGVTDDNELDHYRSKVLDLAKSQGIAIFTVGYQGRGDYGSDRLTRLSESTDGKFFEADQATGHLPPVLFDTLYAYMNNGGQVTFPVRSSPPVFNLTVEMTDGRTISDEKKLQSYTPRFGLVSWWDQQETTKKYIYAGSAAGTFFVCLLLGIWGVRRGGRRSAADEPISQDAPPLGSLAASRPLGMGNTATAIMNGGTAPYNSGGANAATQILTGGDGAGLVYGWLTRSDTTDRIPIRETAVRIGRHEDNDLQIPEESVHRRHAIVHITPQREFIITDLSGPSGNHVFVNGQMVEKKSLKDGDEIKLGKIRLKFQVATI